MKNSTIEKSKIKDLVSFLKGKYRLVGPKAKENQFIIDDIDSPEELVLSYKPSILSLKKFYLPQEEPLLDFSFGSTEANPAKVETKPTMIFGAHTCDIAGVICLDVVCGTDPADKNFFKRKKNILIVGIECLKPCDEYATCITMGTHNPKGGYDLMLTDLGNKYFIEVNSDEGIKAINDSKICKDDDGKTLEQVKKIRNEKEKYFTKNLKPEGDKLYEVLDSTRKNAIWEDIGAKCLSCGNCTNVCPTCYCFDVKDDVNLAVTSGNRSRIWDSCQLKEFAEVAGGENFRKHRKSRQQHRFLRKFCYPVKKYNRYFCVGCGRCTRTCMAKINLIETINLLAKERI